MSFRTKGHGRSARHIPITPKQTAFGEAEHPKLAKDVHAGSVEDSRGSVRQLERDYRGAKTHEQRERIRKATQLEANRLGIGAHNANNSPEARRSLATRAGIFQRAADRMSRQEQERQMEAAA